VTTTTAPDALDALRRRAAVLVDFDLEQFVRTGDDADVVMDFVTSECELVPATGTGLRWAIKPRARAHSLESSTLKGLRAARREVDAELSALQVTLDRSLKDGWSEDDLGSLSPDDARSLSAVATWWDGNRSSVPDPVRLKKIVERLSLFSDAREMAQDHFVGRADVLAELRDHFASGSPPPFVIHGVGGIGKSAVVARHLTFCLDQGHAVAGLVDFDESLANPYYPANIVSRLVTQFASQVSGSASKELERIAAYLEDEGDVSETRSVTQSKTSSREAAQWSRLFDSALRALPPGQPVLLVFDTFEQVQRRGDSAVSSVARLVRGLTNQPRVRVVVSGRAQAPELGPGRELCGLGTGEAVRLLSELVGSTVDEATATSLVEHIGTSPLTVRLAAQLLSRGGESPGDLFALDVGVGQIDAFLYERVLDHLNTPVRALAHPGLVLRRITPEIISKVLARPCKLKIRTAMDAEDLFDELSNELMLVDRDAGARVLTHRSDVRALMLPQLLRDPKVDQARVQRAAIRFYSTRRDPQSRVEELYHRLLVGQSERTLGRHWDERAAHALVPVMDEFPLRSRIYLASHLPETFLREDDRRLVGHSNWVRQVYGQVLRLISFEKYDAALSLLQERRSGDGESLIPDLEIETLEYLGRIPEAIEIARQQRRRAALRNDAETAVTFSLHLSRLLERSAHAGEAIAVLDETLTQAASAPSVDRLRVLVAWLGTSRRNSGSERGLHDERADEAVELFERLGHRQVQKVPGLVRDLAGEAGTRSESVLLEALQTVGLDALASGDIPSALEQLSAMVAAPGQDSDKVADLARLTSEAADVDWEEIVTKARSETGLALSEVIQNFIGEANRLQLAVTLDYQREADAALFAEDLDAEVGPA